MTVNQKCSMTCVLWPLGSALAMAWTGPAVLSLFCWDSSVVLISLTFATTCSKSKDKMARMRSSKMWWVHCNCRRNEVPTTCFKSSMLSSCLINRNSPVHYSLLHSHWRRWQTASGSTRSLTMKSLLSWTSTWRPLRQTVPLWSMFAVSSLLYTNPWLPLVENRCRQTAHTETPTFLMDVMPFLVYRSLASYSCEWLQFLLTLAKEILFWVISNCYPHWYFGKCLQ